MKNSLYEILGISDGSQFEYYEDLENLFEYEGDLDSGEIYNLLKTVDLEVLSELIENYFDDLTDGVPDNSADIFELLSKISNSMKGMARNCEEDSTYLLLAEEMVKFHDWLVMEKNVSCVNIYTGEEKVLAPVEAFILYRMELLGEDKYEYYFDRVLDYDLEDYVLSFKDLVAINEED